MRNGKKETDARKTRVRSPVTGWSDGRTFRDLVAEMEGKSRKPVPRSDPEERMAYDTALTFLHQARLALEAG